MLRAAPRFSNTTPHWPERRQRAICADARDSDGYDKLMPGEQAVMVFTDPPYNVKIDGFAGGKGKAKRREFAMASGEMSENQFEDFLKATLGPAVARCRDGAIAFI